MWAPNIYLPIYLADDGGEHYKKVIQMIAWLIGTFACARFGVWMHSDTCDWFLSWLKLRFRRLRNPPLNWCCQTPHEVLYPSAFLDQHPSTERLMMLCAETDWTRNLQWNLDNSNCRGPSTKAWVMLSLCFNQSYESCSPYVASVASPFHCSVFHFLAKLSRICEIFLSCEKKPMKLSLLHKNVNTSSHIKGNLMALTAVVSSSYD